MLMRGIYTETQGYDNASHQIGYRDQRGVLRNKPTVSKREASATPIALMDTLIRLAMQSIIASDA